MTQTTSEQRISPILKHGTILSIPSGRGYDRYYRVGTVWEYAIEGNRDPQEAYESCVKQGHKTVWINAECVVLDNSGMTPTERYAARGETITPVTIGMQVRIAGKFTTIQTDYNDNLRFEFQAKGGS